MLCMDGSPDLFGTDELNDNWIQPLDRVNLEAGGVERLRELGVPVFGIKVEEKGLAGVSARVQLIARAAGRSREGELLAAGFERRLRQAKESAADAPAVSACCLIWHDPAIAAGAGTFLDDLLSLAGATNACLRGSEEYPRLSKEDLLLARPEVILLATGAMAKSDGASALFEEDWARPIAAVRTGRVLEWLGDAHLRPTVRLADAAEELIALLAEARGRATP